MTKLVRTIKAHVHHINMMNKFTPDIKKSVRKATVIEGFDEIDYFTPDDYYQTNIEILKISPERVAKMYNGEDVTIVNFADFTVPGGRFLLGANTEETGLCMASTLYEVLSNFKLTYRSNQRYRNDGLYYNFGLFTPGILFDDNRCNVLTVSCPDYNEWTNAERNRCIPSYLVNDINSDMVSERIDFLLGALRFMRQKTIVIGAFGCESQTPTKVASEFKRFLETKYKGIFEKVIFAIPNERCLEGFRYIFGRHGNFYQNRYQYFDVEWIVSGRPVHIKVAAYNQDEALRLSLTSLVEQGYRYDDAYIDHVEVFDQRAYLSPEQVLQKYKYA